MVNIKRDKVYLYRLLYITCVSTNSVDGNVVFGKYHSCNGTGEFPFNISNFDNL